MYKRKENILKTRAICHCVPCMTEAGTKMVCFYVPILLTVHTFLIIKTLNFKIVVITRQSILFSNNTIAILPIYVTHIYIFICLLFFFIFFYLCLD